MYDNLAPPNAESSLQCPLCKRGFAKESTRKRHHYYCRSKQSQPHTSRRRACTACIHAKTRCTWSINIGLITCSRCHKRGITCEYDTAAVRNESPLTEHGKSHVATGTVSYNATSSELQLHMASSSYSTAFEFPFISPEASSTDVYQSTEAFLATLPNSNWEADMGQFESLASEIELVGAWNFGSTSNSPNDAPNLRKSPSIPRSLDSFGSNSFGLRTFSKPSQAPMATLLVRTLRSYTFKMLGKETLPPFMSPLLYSLAEAGEGPHQQSLISCITFVRMFKSQTKGNRSFIWKLIRVEQERILVEYLDFDRWELLAALQALLVYCLLRLLEDPVGNDSFDAPLLVTARLVIIAISSSVQTNHILDVAQGAQPSWDDWIFNESRRRILLVFGILLMVVDISVVVACAPKTGYLLVPMASSVKLWHAMKAELWRSEFDLCYDERTVYGLSESGELTQLRQNEVGIQSSPAEWDEWVAEVGEIGTLVMIAGSLV